MHEIHGPSMTFQKCVIPSSVLQKHTKDVHKLYDFSHEIGRGSFGVVWSCNHRKTGKQFAIKEIIKIKLKDLEEVEDIRREVEMMKLLSGHPNIVSFEGAYEDESSVYLVMELCSGGELFDLVRSVRCFKESDAALIFYDIVKAVDHCHSIGIVHRDLKPENLFLIPATCHGEESNAFKVRVKLGDFGLSMALPPGKMTLGSAGSKFYESPERLAAKPHDHKCDIWSLGVILYILLCGRLPYMADSKQGMLNKVMRNSIDLFMPPWTDVSSSVKSLIRRLLSLDPQNRPSTEEILKDDWLTTQIPEKLIHNADNLASCFDKSLHSGRYVSLKSYAMSPIPKFKMHQNFSLEKQKCTESPMLKMKCDSMNQDAASKKDGSSNGGMSGGTNDGITFKTKLRWNQKKEERKSWLSYLTFCFRGSIQKVDDFQSIGSGNSDDDDDDYCIGVDYKCSNFGRKLRKMKSDAFLVDAVHMSTKIRN